MSVVAGAAVDEIISLTMDVLDVVAAAAADDDDDDSSAAAAAAAGGGGGVYSSLTFSLHIPYLFGHSHPLSLPKSPFLVLSLYPILRLLV